MNETFLIIDDVVKDPKSLVDLSRKTCYYTFENRTIDGVNLCTDQSKLPGGLWRGYRSASLFDLNQELFTEVFNQVQEKTFKFDLNKISAYFAIIPEFANYGISTDHWWHVDQCDFAGLIYLNENPIKTGCGTILKIDDQNVVVENKFNRLAIYKNILHRPHRFFGQTIENSRLTLTFFGNY